MKHHRMYRVAVGIAILVVAGSASLFIARSLTREFDPSPGALPVIKPRRTLTEDEAKRMLDLIAAEYEKDANINPDSILHLAEGRELIGDLKGAKRAIASAIEKIKTMPASEKVDPLLALAARQTACGDRAEALRSYHEALSILAREPYRRFEDAYLESIACDLAILGDREGSQAAVKRLIELAEQAPPPTMKEPNLRARLRGRALETLARLGEFDRAFDLVMQSLAKNLFSNQNETRPRMLTWIAMGAGPTSYVLYPLPASKTAKEKKASADAIRKIIDETESLQFEEDRPSADELALSFAEVGEFDDALRVARTMGQGPSRWPRPNYPEDPRIWVFDRIALSQIKAGRTQDAAATRAEGLRIIRASGNVKKIAEAELELSLASKDEKAAASAIETVPRGDRAEMLVKLADMCEDSGKLDQARSSLELALDDLRYRFNHPPLAAKKKKPMGIIDWLNSLVVPASPENDDSMMVIIGRNGQLVIDPNHPNVGWWTACLAKIIFVRAKAGDIDTAQKLLKTETIQPFLAQILRSIAALQAEQGDPQGAFRWAAELKNDKERSEAMIGIMIGTVRNRNRAAGERPGFYKAEP